MKGGTHCERQCNSNDAYEKLRSREVVNSVKRACCYTNNIMTMMARTEITIKLPFSGSGVVVSFRTCGAGWCRVFCIAFSCCIL